MTTKRPVRITGDFVDGGHFEAEATNVRVQGRYTAGNWGAVAFLLGICITAPAVAALAGPALGFLTFGGLFLAFGLYLGERGGRS